MDATEATEVAADGVTVAVPRGTMDQFCYHVRMAAVFGLSGDVAESASESMLAWAILTTLWPDAADAALAASRELVGQEIAGASVEHRTAAARRAATQALDLEGHLVSVGMHDEATLYATVADRLDDVAASLANDPA